jgi:ceramide glucosyltransferase
MTFIFYILAAALIYLSYRSFRGGVDYLNFFKKEMARPRSDRTPFATIIAPCKGLDDGLERNMAVLIEQDYPEYEVIFVVDDENDAALPIIKGLMNRRDAEMRRNENSASPCLASENIKLVVAPKATDSSQKVENLREAVLHASGESRVFVFVDSDARPPKEWLRHLVAPLEDKDVGASTGYRWFISNKPSFASEMRSVWNASIASALGANTRSNFCWGGSMAIRRDTFERLDIREKWKGTLSDDFTVTRALNAAKMPVYFVPQALTASIENCTWRQLFEFTTRQMKITRVYAPKLWLMSFFGSGLFNFVMAWALAIVIFSKRNDLDVWAAIVTLLSVSAASIGKSWLRLNAAALVLTEHRASLKKQWLPQNSLWMVAPALFFYNSFAAWASKKMSWRGIGYEMVSPNETRVLDRPQE